MRKFRCLFVTQSRCNDWTDFNGTQIDYEVDLAIGYFLFRYKASRRSTLVMYTRNQNYESERQAQIIYLDVSTFCFVFRYRTESDNEPL